MSALTPPSGRLTRIACTRGYIDTDSSVIKVSDYMTNEWREIHTKASGAGMDDGHGGDDEGIIDAFITALATNTPSHIVSAPDETLESHLTVFTAEEAHPQGSFVQMD